MVNLKALEASLLKIESVGKDELDFEAGGIKITLQPLSASQENEVERYSRTAYEDEEGNAINMSALPESERTLANRIWIDRLRQATIAYAIAETDGTNLRGVEFIETGEIDDNDNPISRPRYEVLRDLVTRWGRPVLTQMFAAYGELVDRINLRASRLVQFDTADTEEEKIRLQRRLDDLEQRDEGIKGPQSVGDVAQSFNEVGVAQQKTAAKMREESGGTETVAKHNEQPASMPSVRKGVQRAREALQNPPRDPASEAVAEELRSRTSTPPRAPGDGLPEGVPPEDPAPISKTPRQSLSARTAPPPPERQEEDSSTGKIPDPYEGDSFFDPSDGEDAYKAEMVRQEEMFRRKQERDRQTKEAREKAEAEGKTPIIQGRAKKPAPQATAGAIPDDRSGLRSALNTGNSVFDVGADSMQRSQPSRQPTGKRGQTDIYRMPTTTLERRGPQTDPSQIELDPGKIASNNPRFKPARED